MRLLLVKLPAPRNWLKQERSAWVFSSDLLHGLPENELKTELCAETPEQQRGYLVHCRDLTQGLYPFLRGRC